MSSTYDHWKVSHLNVASASFSIASSKASALVDLEHAEPFAATRAVSVTDVFSGVTGVLFELSPAPLETENMGTANATAKVRDEHQVCPSHPNVEDSARRVLVVSSAAEDRRSLARMLASHTCGQYWTATVRGAAEWLNRSSANVVICDDRLPDGHWQELWEHLRRQPDPPVFIVSAAWNDAHLWAEVPNLGAYDVLVKPYQKSEVTRILQHACRRFEHFA